MQRVVSTMQLSAFSQYYADGGCRRIECGDEIAGTTAGPASNP